MDESEIRQTLEIAFLKVILIEAIRHSSPAVLEGLHLFLQQELPVVSQNLSQCHSQSARPLIDKMANELRCEYLDLIEGSSLDQS